MKLSNPSPAMATVPETHRPKRLLSDDLPPKIADATTSEEDAPAAKRGGGPSRRVRFDDEEDRPDGGGDVEDRDRRRTELEEARNTRSSSPFAGCDMRLCEELYASSSSSSSSFDPDDDDDDDERATTDTGHGDRPRTYRVDRGVPYHECSSPSSSSSSSSDGDVAIVVVAPMMPLITPPSSPRTIRAPSVDGASYEWTTICEWPSNLIVECAMTAALELLPYRDDAAAVETTRPSGP
jgi:hypothetical protein